MKKQLLFVAMAAIAMASCSKDETSDVNQGAAMNFRASLGKTISRAAETNLANLNGFNVTAIGNGAAYFTDMSVTSSDNGVTWTTSPTRYWPDYELAFFAYAPQTTSGAVINTTSKTISGYLPAAAAADQKDLVISYNTGTKAANEASGVAMNFKHALSQIQVKAKNSNTAAMKVEIAGVKVANVSTKGTFNFPEVETTAAYTLAASNWTGLTPVVPGDGCAYKSNGTAGVVLTAAAQTLMFGNADNTENWMLIPQSQTAWDGGATNEGSYLAVLCRISNVDNGNETLLWPDNRASNKVTIDGKEYAYSAVGAAMDWEPGKRYIYTLEFFGENGGGGEIDPVDPDPTDPGEEIIGGPIKFTVTVDEWQDAGNTDLEM